MVGSSNLNVYYFYRCNLLSIVILLRVQVWVWFNKMFMHRLHNR